MVENLIGKRFGRLVVISRAPNGRNWHSRWNCICDCGNQCIVSASHLKNGHTQSCGCYHIEQIKEKNTKHGYFGSAIYLEHNAMKKRCYNSNHNEYHIYGGRGITMYEPWQKSFQAYYDYVSKLPNFGKEGYTLNRIDNDGNYEPNNVEWATPKEQANNTRRNRFITYDGRAQTLQQWADETGIKVGTLWARLERGWSVEKALTKHNQ